MTSKPERVFDVVVIGGGTAGMTAARLLVNAGQRVALIEQDRTGGECLYTGCVPSKTLIASARVAHAARTSSIFGVKTGKVSINPDQVFARIRTVIDQISEVDSPATLERHGIHVVKGAARFISPTRVETASDAFIAARFVIATGSRPFVPPIPGLETVPYLTNETVFELRTIPSRLVIIGAGPIGMELGQAFGRLGSVVTIVDSGPRVLASDDDAHARLVHESVAAEGVTIHTQTRIVRVETSGSGIRLAAEREDGPPFSLDADQILVAAGRIPDTADLNLEAAGIALDNGHLPVNESLRTTAEHIWACGDVIGPPRFTHAAEDQARTVASNVLGGRATWSPRAIPWVTFTDPEIAGVGLTERSAQETYGDKLTVLTLPYDRIDRAVTDGATSGEIKILIAPGWMRGAAGGEIVGAHIVGANAGEVIQQFAFMIAWRMPSGMLAKVVQSYPTYSIGGRQALGQQWEEMDLSPSLLDRIRNKLT